MLIIKILVFVLFCFNYTFRMVVLFFDKLFSKNVISESTVTVQYASTITEISNWLTTLLPPTVKAFSFTENGATVGITIRKTMSTTLTIKPTENNIGKNKLHMINYVYVIKVVPHLPKVLQYLQIGVYINSFNFH